MPTPRAAAVRVLVGTPDQALFALLADKLDSYGFVTEHIGDVRALEARVSRGEHQACLIDPAWHEAARLLAGRPASGPLLTIERLDTPADEFGTRSSKPSPTGGWWRALDPGVLEIVPIDASIPGLTLARLIMGAIRRFQVEQRTSIDLHDQRGLLQTLLHTLPLFVGSIDDAGGLQWANPELSRLLGTSAVELRTSTLFDVLVIDRAERERLAAGVERASGEWVLATVRGADRRLREIEWLSAPLPTAGLLIVGRDVTAYRALERHLSQVEKLDAMGRLTGGVAHDFNNIVTVVAGSAQLIADYTAAGSREHVEALEIVRACQSARALTSRLLAFSRTDRQQSSVIDLNGAIRHVQPMLERLIGPEAELVFTFADRRLPVCIDEGQVDQVLVNLAINARDAIAGTGTITIETTVVEVDAAEAARHRRPLRVGPHARLTCTDTGAGMSEETRERLFEPFYTTKPAGHGTGIGLATVHTIVTGAQGAIEVSSTVGQGTTFTVLLPIERRRQRLPTPAGASADSASPLTTVLLIEDHDGIRALCGRVLEREGHRVLAAASGADGLALLRAREDVGLVITDVRLGEGGNGLALIDVIRRERPMTRLLLMSGQPQGPMPPDVAFLAKPFTPAALVATVRSLIEHA
jgi:signal transduction histidine kinase